MSLVCLTPYLVTPLTRAIEKYICGLPMQIQDTIWGSNSTTLNDIIPLAARPIDYYVVAVTLSKNSGKNVAKMSTTKPDKEAKF